MDARNPDEIVVAGLTPNKRRNSPFDSNHRGNSLILLIDLAILGYLAYLLADAGVQMFNSYLVNGVLFVVIAGFYSIWFGYRTRKKWAYWPAVGILILVTILFLMFAAFNLWFILQGDLSGFFVVIFISFAVFSTIRRIMQHFHPMYIAAYLDRGVKIQGFDLAQGEMYAACPTCFSILAIIPSQLSPEDNCPHCGNPLVDGALAASDSTNEQE